MADEDLTLNEDQLLDNLDDTNGDVELLNEVSFIRCGSNKLIVWPKMLCERLVQYWPNSACVCVCANAAYFFFLYKYNL